LEKIEEVLNNSKNWHKRHFSFPFKKKCHSVSKVAFM
jgi:hypothetical protein